MSRASETATADGPGRSVSLGDLRPAGSRHRGRRSAVAFAGDSVVVGRADGSVVAVDHETLAERWSTAGEGSAVTLLALAGSDGEGEEGRRVGDGDGDGDGEGEVDGDGDGDGTGDGRGDSPAVVVGERSARGAVRVLDAETGEQRWRHETAADVGDPDRDTRFFLPFVVDAVTGTDGGTSSLYVAARRYERRDGGRAFESVVYAFDPDGTERWRYETDASPISLDVSGDRIGIAYNRCPGTHEDGLVVLDARTGTRRWRWDPPESGERRVGDVSLAPGDGRLEDHGDRGRGDRGASDRRGGAVVTSHADYRGYALSEGGEVRWSADLATPVQRDGDTVYAYPNHVHSSADGVAFVTGNTYPEDGRETDARHPRSHAILGYADGEQQWTDSVEGFANGVATDGPTVAVPCAQAFRERDAAAHGLRVFDVQEGRRRTVSTRGIVTAAVLAGDRAAAVEEPVRYHDEGTVHGAYRLHVLER